jgi:superfamily II DNA helicase RecQ
VNRAYANTTSGSFRNVWDGLIRQNLQASFLWQGLWGVTALLTPARKRKASLHDIAGAKEIGGAVIKRPQLLQRVAKGTYRRRPQWTATEIRQGAQRLFQDTKFEWRSPEQERAITTVLSGAEQVVAILPTGAGKSMLFLLPCTLPGAGVTIVIVPLVSLRADLLRRIGKLGIEHLVWAEGEQRDAPLVLVSTEAACTKAFLTYAQRLVTAQALDRIVIDECHLTITAADYRESMVNVALIRQVRTQFVYLTATLPPSMQPAFERQNYLHQPKVIRESSNRPNLFYMVATASDDSPFLEAAALEAQESWATVSTNEVWPHNEVDQHLAKALIYVQRRAQADELANLLNCSAYTAGSGTAEEKAMIIRNWLTSNVPFLVATTALGAGFDYPYIRMVLHVDEPTSLVDFAQASGRAGRDGQVAFATVLLPHSWRATSSLTDPEQAALHRYLQGVECYRACLSAALDVPSQQQTSCLEADVTCNVCARQSQDIEVQVGSEEPLPLEEPAVDAVVQASTGSQLIHEQRYIEYLELQRYKEDLRVVVGTCLICRASRQEWDHEFSRCSQRSDFIRVWEEVKASKANWIQAYHACF